MEVEEGENYPEELISKSEDYCCRHGGPSPSLENPNLRNGSEHARCLDPGGEVLGQRRWLSSEAEVLAFQLEGDWGCGGDQGRIWARKICWWFRIGVR